MADSHLTGSSDGPGKPVFTRIDHVGFAVKDLDAAIEFWTSTYGLECVHTEINEEQGVREAMLKVGETTTGPSYIQLLQPTRPDSPVGKFIERNGEGVQQVAFGVSDLASAMEVSHDHSVRTTSAEPRHGTFGSKVAFLHPKDTGGVLVELVEANPDGEH